jgi:hypothetical protein
MLGMVTNAQENIEYWTVQRHKCFLDTMMLHPDAFYKLSW